MEYTEIFAKLIEDLKQKHALDISNVINAFNLAERLHHGQFRKSGEPYILHPVSVAYILEKLDFDCNVITAGLLHDVVEDCGCTVDEIAEKFNTTVAQIVDAVTKIELDFETKSQDFSDAVEEIKTYQKLIAIGKENMFAFYIKFADRLHNLSTIGCFKKYKKQEKVKETEKWLMPFLKLLRAYEFYTKISNECFKIQNEEDFNQYKRIYNNYFSANERKIRFIKEFLNVEFSKFFTKQKLNNELNKIIVDNCTELEVYESVKKVTDIEDVNDIKRSFLNNLALTKIYLVFKSSKHNKDLNDLLLNFLFDKKFNNYLKVIGYGIDEFTSKTYIIVEDDSRIKYKLFVFNQKTFMEFRNGTTEGVDISYVDTESTTEVVSNYIKIFTKDGNVVYMPENSTVLDFAFKIHQDFGFACNFAYLNDSPVKSPIYTKLSEGDKVELVIQKNEKTGHTENIAQLRWIMYAKTETAQKYLVKYFENLYE